MSLIDDEPQDITPHLIDLRLHDVQEEEGGSQLNDVDDQILQTRPEAIGIEHDSALYGLNDSSLASSLNEQISFSLGKQQCVVQYISNSVSSVIEVFCLS